MLRRSGRAIFKRRRINLKRTLFVLPNMITLSSVFCGFYSMVISSKAVSDEDFHRSALLIVFAMFFDMLDGRVARMTRTQSAFGLQIDSLADVLSFGAAPALLMYHLTLKQLDWIGLVVGFAYTACGAVRLARFNVLASDPNGAPAKPGKYIVGLPIPGAAGILVAIVVASHAAGGLAEARSHSGWIAGIMALLSALMVSSVYFRSFKDIRLNVRTAALVLGLIATSAAVAARFQPSFVLLWLLGCYIFVGLFEWVWQLPRRWAEFIEPRLSDPPPPRSSSAPSPPAPGE